MPPSPPGPIILSSPPGPIMLSSPPGPPPGIPGPLGPSSSLSSPDIPGPLGPCLFPDSSSPLGSGPLSSFGSPLPFGPPLSSFGPSFCLESSFFCFSSSFFFFSFCFRTSSGFTALPNLTFLKAFGESAFRICWRILGSTFTGVVGVEFC